MKTVCVFIFCVACLKGFSQSEIPVEDRSQKATQEQRIVNETNKKSKGGKKKVSLKEKIKISQKQDKKARKATRPPSTVKRKKKKRS